MRVCAVCKKNFAPGSGSLFSVPKEQRQKWGDILGKTFAPTNEVCSDHFLPSSILRVGKKSYLLPNAEPCIRQLAKDGSKVTGQGSQAPLPKNIFLKNNDVNNGPVLSVSTTQTNTRLCGLVHASHLENEYHFLCFYCTAEFPLEKWKNFLNHLKDNHFEMEAFKIPKKKSATHFLDDSHSVTKQKSKISKQIAADHDYIPAPQPFKRTKTPRTIVPNVNPSKKDVSNLAFDNTPNVNITVANISNINSPFTKTVSEIKMQKKSSVPSGEGLKQVKYIAINKNAYDNSKVNSSEIASTVQVMEPKVKEVCEPVVSFGIVQKQPTEIAFKFSPRVVVDLLLDNMKNYPVLWEFHNEPFKEEFYDASEDLCKIVNDKWSLNIDNLRMRRSINRILRFYCYLYPNTNVENIDEFTYYYDKCATFLPSSVNEIAYARCSHCYICYKSDFDLKNHLVQERKYLQWPYKCAECKECFRGNDEYEFHNSLSHYDEVFRCEPCNKTFFRRNVYNRHRVQFHSNEKGKYKCQVCGKGFQTSSLLGNHRLTHGEKTQKCHLCPKSFFEKARLRIHLKSHQNQYDYTCEICGKRFLINQALLQHRKIHTGDDKVTCNICNLSLRKPCLGRHLRLMHVPIEGTIESILKKKKRRTMGRRTLRTFERKKEREKRKYFCKICNVKFENFKSLICHNKDLHSDGKKWPCEFCSAVYNVKENLKSHYRKKHDFSSMEAFELIHKNQDLNEVLNDKTDDDSDVLAKCKFVNVSDHVIVMESNSDTSPIKSEFSPNQISFEEEKYQSFTLQDEIKKASDNIITTAEENKIDYMNEFFTDLLK